MTKRLSILFLCLAASAAAAQHAGPYAGQHGREIKALSAEEVAQYLSGAGMGYAKAAELNQYPGPMHALELADALKLSAEQRAALKALMTSHKEEARGIGKRLVEAEAELDQLFSAKAADAATLRAKVFAAGQLQGEYRLAHLETHRRARSLLTAEQVASYDALRGYGGAAAKEHRGH
jgi:Spy/CpxP family protein refolding chaperone